MLFLLALGVTVTVFSYLLSLTSLNDLQDVFRSLDWRYVAIFFLCSFSMSVARTWRYWMLLESNRIAAPKVRLFLIVLVRNFFADLLPARLGTLIYIFLVQNRLRIPAAAATTSFSLSFLFDLLSLPPLLIGAALLWMPGSSFSIVHIVLSAAVFFLLAALFVLFLAPLCVLGRFLVESAPALSVSSKKKAARFLDTVRVDFIETANAGILGRVFALSLLVRVFKYSGLYAFLLALLVPLGYQPSELPLGGILIGICTAELSASLPISGIAGFGTYEGAWHFMFRFIGFPSNISSLTAIAHHAFTQAYGYSLGLLAFILLALPFWGRTFAPAETHPRSKMKFFSLLCGWILGLCLIAGGISSIPANVFSKPRLPPQHPELSHDELTRAARALKGNVLFDSNASGRFHIYELIPQTGETRQLTFGDTDDMYPDPSSDGSTFVFARHLSTNRLSPSDIWIYDRSSGRAHLLIENGSFPTYAPDSKTVFFERKRSSVWSVNIDGQQEKKVFPLHGQQNPKRQVVKPRLDPSGSWVAYTSDFPARWHAWIAPLSGEQPAIKLGEGCEPTWLSSGEVLFVSPVHTRAGSGLVQFHIATRGSSIALDKDGAFGHEYFPSAVPHSSLILYSATSADQHSHESGNYQLFVYDTNSAQRLQLTSNTSTNRWPKWIPAMASSLQPSRESKQ